MSTISKLPKVLYATVKYGARSSDNWIEATSDKDSLVDEGGEVIGTYVLQKQEVGEALIQYKPKR